MILRLMPGDARKRFGKEGLFGGELRSFGRAGSEIPGERFA